MVLGEAVVGAAAGAQALFGYNRENFMYDRKQRQEFEFKVQEWRSTQAELWRDDVREIIGLTEKKMDTYLIVGTLQLGMCVGLFSEGRLEPGTPPWLLHLYMLTLGAAFMYLLMSVWLAMHASVVASCSSVRLLTQFVRLPVPTWGQLEQMRTYAQSVESLEMGSLLRVPFTNKRDRGSQRGLASDAKSVAGSPSSAQEKADPWGLEQHGDHRGLYELQEQPAALRRHIGLAQRAARQYQCFDAFARVAMSFGTNQLLNAITYYVLGYVAVQDGAPFAAVCVGAIMVSIALALVHLDFSLSLKEQMLAKLLVSLGPACSSLATFARALGGPNAETYIMTLLPIAYASHGLWLFFALITCGLQLQENGSVLPMRFRAVLYLDVFGWISKNQPQQAMQGRQRKGSEVKYDRLPEQSQVQKGCGSRLEQLEALRADMAQLPSEKLQRALAAPAAPSSAGAGAGPSGQPDLEECRGGAVEGSPKSQSSLFEAMGAVGPSGEHAVAPDHIFHATSYAGHDMGGASADEEADTDIVTGHDKMNPGRLPAKVFRLATMLLIFLWVLGLALPFGAFREFVTKPLTAEFRVEAGGEEGGRESLRGEAHAAALARGRGAVESLPEQEELHRPDLPTLEAGEILQVGWPTHSGFVPRSLSCDPSGTKLVVADDLGVYAGQTSLVAERRASVSSSAQHVASAARTLLATGASLPTPRQVLGVTFEHLPPCTALEGQALRDVGVICGGRLKEHQTCRVVVLHARGRRLAECPLPSWGKAGAQAGEGRDLLPAKPMVIWTISSEWLHGHARDQREHVESFAVNSKCLHKGSPRGGRSASSSCVVVGTTSGRIVQLRGAVKDERRLVPERAMQQRQRSVGRGSLHVFPNGLVAALRRGSGVLEAFNSRLGTAVGEWRLPGGVDWLMLCGGGENLFVLGLRNRTHTELWRFLLPMELQADSARAHEKGLPSPALAGRIHEI